MRSDNLVSERVGKVSINNHGSIMKVVEYINSNNIIVKFEKGEPVYTNWYHFTNGTIKHPYDKTVHGVGYLGEGNCSPNENGKNSVLYKTWQVMFQRCYSENYQKNQPTYIGCTVIEDWHNFQNFAKWYDENYYEVEGERMQLDKDILIKGNKVYSPDACVFVPQRINTLFVKTNSKRGDLPIGVSKERNKYLARCQNGRDGLKRIGLYKTKQEAFHAYKEYKEHMIKDIAKEYKEKIPRILYDALMSYRVDIND